MCFSACKCLLSFWGKQLCSEHTSYVIEERVPNVKVLRDSMARSPLSISILTSNGVWNVTIKISALGCNCDLCSISFIPSLFYSSNIKCFCEPCIENKKNHEKLHMTLEISLSPGEIDTNTIIHNIIINNLYHHYRKHLELLGKMHILRRVILVWLCKKNNGELINTFSCLII